MRTQPFDIDHRGPGNASGAASNGSTFPMVLTIWILCMAATGFACGVKGLPAWYQVLCALLPISAILMLWGTHLADPGVIPPSQDKDPIYLLLEDGNVDGVPDRDNYLRDPETFVWKRKVPYRGGTAFEKYCVTCNVWRPPRASHCQNCGHCMLHFDHHCDVMGNCIAQNNHRFFTGFLVTSQAACGLLLGGTLWRLRHTSVSVKSDWTPEAVVLLLLAVLYAYHLLMLIFGNVHCFFMIFDVTSKDCVISGDIKKNPPCVGTRKPRYLLSNLQVLCCGPVRFKPQHHFDPYP